MRHLPQNVIAPPDLLDYALSGCGRPRDHATAETFSLVGSLLRVGRISKALEMLEYAQRLSPSDGGISLAIALLRLSLGEPRASEPLEMLARRSDWRVITMTLVRVRLRFGHIERAAVDLGTALSQSGAPRKPAEIRLANTVSERVNAPGWCALDNTGRVVLGASGNLATVPTVLLDGQPVPSLQMSTTVGTRAFQLPPQWARASRLDVLLDGRALIGSPLLIGRIARVEGFVEAIPDSGALRGWCWFPAERERVPTITIAALGEARRRISVVADITDPNHVRGDEFGLPYGFAVEPEVIAALGAAVTVTGPHDRSLYGSPLWPHAARDAALAAVSSAARLFPLSGGGGAGGVITFLRESSAPVATTVPFRASTEKPAPRGIDIVIPVYTGREVTLGCIQAVRVQRSLDERIVVVIDGSPDAELIAALQTLAAQGHILLQVEDVNRGFPGAANIGLRLAAGHDVVLLNSDTVVTPGWLGRLRQAIHAAPNIGTATPLSNDATIFSYPRRDAANLFPEASEATALAALAAAVNGEETVEVPTGHGFCLYIRAECLEETGLFREDLFAQGCGEENDFCMRARHLGWRHVAVPGAFVAHYGSQSFNAARDDLLRRNLATLNRLHLGYDRLIADWQARDPLAMSRRRIDLARLLRANAGRDSVLIVTHDRAGGVRQHVSERIKAIAQDGCNALVLRPANVKGTDGRIAGRAVLLDTGFDDAYPNLRFRLPEESAALVGCLRDCAIREIEVNSLIGHDENIIDVIREQTAPLDIVIHDYSWFCPRITLTTFDNRYCGEPEIAICRDCVAVQGSNLDEDISPDELLFRSRRLFEPARAIVGPSEDTARRMRSHFGVTVTVRPWQTPRSFDLRAVRSEAGRTRKLRICVVGAIGPEKGYDRLLACARAAAKARLQLEFVVVGYTSDDRRLLDTGVVRITGRYAEAEAVALIAAQDADFAWLPSVWPETWSYVLTQSWEARLHVVVHDIGAPAERVRAQGGGMVVPLHLPAERMVALFLETRFTGPKRRNGLMPSPSRAQRPTNVLRDAGNAA
jgi:GT2 family glycosyltransferase/glycosyltransferase involved in cell wall biosynthesis